MRRRIAIIDHEALPGGVKSQLDFWPALCPTLECILKVREGQPRIGPRKRRIEAQGDFKEMAGPIVVDLVDPVHVPQATMMRAPGVEGTRRLQNRAVALDRF